VTDAGIDGILGERVVKFLHGHSHREEARPSSGLDFPAIEDELRLVLRFMRDADPKHFDRMCRGVAVDPSLLAAACASAAIQSR
jgi:hypothetical protein